MVEVPDLLTFLAFRAASESGENVPHGSLPEKALSQLTAWGRPDGWWNREWATAAEASEALDITVTELQGLVDGKQLIGYDIDGALHIPSRELATAAWEKAQLQVE